MRKLLFFFSLGVLILFSVSICVLAEEGEPIIVSEEGEAVVVAEEGEAIIVEETKSDLVQEKALDEETDSFAGQMQEPKEEKEDLKDVGDIAPKVDYAAEEEVLKEKEVAEKAPEIIQQTKQE